MVWTSENAHLSIVVFNDAVRGEIMLNLTFINNLLKSPYSLPNTGEVKTDG